MKNFTYIKSILIWIVHFLFSYFVICDPNPLYYLFTFYLPFYNFFRVIFICLFHSYMMAKFDENRNCKENQLIGNSSQVNTVPVWNSEDTTNNKIDFFLSDFFYYLLKNKCI